MPTEVHDIPPGRVQAMVQQLVDSGATRIECQRQDDGLWTIRAV